MNQTNHCFYVACPERSANITVYVLLYVLAVALALLTVGGNLLVIISVCHFKQLHTPTNILILSLASSDLLVGLFAMPLDLTWMIESCWIHGSSVCTLGNIVNFLVVSTSVHSVALIAVDRFLALSFPFLYAEKITLVVISVVVLLDWGFLFLLIIIMLYISGNFADVYMCPGECVTLFSHTSYLIDIMVVFIVPCSLIIILYGQVFVLVRKHASAIRKSNQVNPEGKKDASSTQRSERKAAKVLGILVSVFLACLGPYYISSFVPTDDAFYVTLLLLPLMFINSAINPIIYALFYPWFKRSSTIILTFQIFQKDSSLTFVQS